LILQISGCNKVNYAVGFSNNRIYDKDLFEYTKGRPFMRLSLDSLCMRFRLLNPKFISIHYSNGEFFNGEMDQLAGILVETNSEFGY
jgi:hypothetical protein